MNSLARQVSSETAERKLAFQPHASARRNQLLEAFAGSGMLQRKPACACGGGCPRCQAASSKLNIGAPDDQYEREADAVADRVMRIADSAVETSPVTPTIQRKCESCEEEDEEDETLQPKADQSSASGQSQAVDKSASVTHSVREVLNSAGQPLDRETRAFFEPRFGQDFSQVRTHTDGKAAESARAVNALAYTMGKDIVFGSERYAPGTEVGNRLIAHELTHTLQQNGQMARQVDAGAPEDIRDAGESLPGGVPEAPAAPEATPTTPEQPQQPPPVRTQNVTAGSAWSECRNKRPQKGSTTRVSGFTGDTAGTYISDIQVTIHANTASNVALTWANGGLSTQTLSSSFNSSPGAGNCTTDCSDACNSAKSGSHCTSLSPPNYTVEGYGCQLGSYPTATFVTWFNYARGIAFHYYDVPSYPASHGCVRMERSSRGAEWICDNTLAGITNVTVSRDPAEGPGPKCWRGGTLVNRPRTAPSGPTGSCAPPPTQRSP
jgi:hypothetical protein